MNHSREEAQVNSLEPSAASLKEQYSAMRKRLAQAELQIDKMRFGGTNNKVQPQEPLHQVTSSLRRKLEEHYDLPIDGTFKNKEQQREGGVNSRDSCTSAESGDLGPGTRKRRAEA